MYPRLLLVATVTLFWILVGTLPAQSDNYTIYFESDRDGEVRIYRLDGSSATPIASEGCRHPSVTADGSMLVYTRLEETLWGRFWNVFFTLNGEEYKLSTNEIYDELEPVISRDGTFAAYTTMRAGNLEIITAPLDQNDLQYRITNTEKPDELPALAGGEDWVYWTGRTGVFSYLFRAPGRGGASERISATAAVWEEQPSVSADGRYIVYSAVMQEEASEEDETEDNDFSELTDGVRPRLASNKYPGYGGGGIPEPEPDEDEPMFNDDDDGGEAADLPPPASEGNSDIWVLDTVTGTRTRLTTHEAWDGHPAISADGEVIVFTSDRDGNFELYMINRDCSGLTRLTDNEATDDYATIT